MLHPNVAKGDDFRTKCMKSVLNLPGWLSSHMLHVWNLPTFGEYSPTSSQLVVWTLYTQWYFLIMLRWLYLDDHPDSQDVPIHGDKLPSKGLLPLINGPAPFWNRQGQSNMTTKRSKSLLNEEPFSRNVWYFSCLKKKQQLRQLHFRKTIPCSTPPATGLNLKVFGNNMAGQIITAKPRRSP